MMTYEQFLTDPRPLIRFVAQGQENRRMAVQMEYNDFKTVFSTGYRKRMIRPVFIKLNEAAESLIKLKACISTLEIDSRKMNIDGQCAFLLDGQMENASADVAEACL